jgi:fibro-slime domain-containing protein
MISTDRYLVLCVCCLVGGAIAGASGCGDGSGINAGTSGGGSGGVSGQSGGGMPGNGGAGLAGVGGAGGGATVPSGGGTAGGGSGGGSGGLAIVDGGSPGIDASSTPLCGQPGTACCGSNTCAGGGCCVSGICMAAGGACVGLGGGVCSAGACGSCGGPGLPCCGTNPATGVCTSPGTTCNNGSCTKCGDLGSPCCASGSGGAGTCTSGNALCSNNICLACGAPGSACCPGNKCDGSGCCYNSTCTAEGSACGTSGTCQAGRCSGCGSAAQACCANLCYDGLLCKSGACTACGGLAQACCPVGTATGVCQAGTACTSTGSDGVCARCGSLGDMCCAGNACSDGCCSGGRCLAPGGPACPIGSPDGGASLDAPMGGSGGTGGVGGQGGASGAGGVGGAGGTAGTGGTGGSITPWTAPAGCGDGFVVAPERCDDGNTLPFDGCSSDCQLEPTCSGTGPCTSKCGDGLVIGEECDDGNVLDGDGCSSACKVEAGFTCTQPALADHILVPVVYRDFRFHTPPDFEAGATGLAKALTGMVNAALDSDGKPVYSGLAATTTYVQSSTTFASWYRNTDGVNHATGAKLALWDNGNGAYVNRYGANGERWKLTDTALWCGAVGTEALDSDGNPIPCTYKYASSTMQTDCDKYVAMGEKLLQCINNLGTYQGIFLAQEVDGNPLFFPVDGDAFSKADMTGAQVPSDPKGLYDSSGTWPWDKDSSGNKIPHNFSFTSEIRYWLKYDASRSYRLDIVGDDDVWVFINKKLVVDLGGVHTPVTGSISIDATLAANLGLSDGNVYEVAVFQAERQSTSSTFKITLGGFNTSPSVCTRN